jgi:hypothetical protein
MALQLSAMRSNKAFRRLRSGLTHFPIQRPASVFLVPTGIVRSIRPSWLSQRAASSQAGKLCLPWHRAFARIGIVPHHLPASLDKLLAIAQGYAEFAMRNIGQVPPALLTAAA